MWPSILTCDPLLSHLVAFLLGIHLCIACHASHQWVKRKLAQRTKRNNIFYLFRQWAMRHPETLTCRLNPITRNEILDRMAELELLITADELGYPKVDGITLVSDLSILPGQFFPE